MLKEILAEVENLEKAQLELDGHPEICAAVYRFENSVEALPKILRWLYRNACQVKHCMLIVRRGDPIHLAFLERRLQEDSLMEASPKYVCYDLGEFENAAIALWLGGMLGNSQLVEFQSKLSVSNLATSMS